MLDVPSFTSTWLANLNQLLDYGELVSPRDKQTRELLHHTTIVDMTRPVLMVPARKLSYQFMCAEAYWMLTGDRTVDGIAPWNKHIAQFSDDGRVFSGAYGPKIVDQMPYVVQKLADDPTTRQAGLTLWRENPPESLDIPCTIAMFFSIREGRLNNHVFMRSSDAWLGQPYDVFNFSMVAHLVCAKINRVMPEPVAPGTLYLTAASYHLYEAQWDLAAETVKQSAEDQPQHATPAGLWCNSNQMLDWLKALRDTKPGHELRWWE